MHGSPPLLLPGSELQRGFSVQTKGKVLIDSGLPNRPDLVVARPIWLWRRRHQLVSRGEAVGLFLQVRKGAKNDDGYEG